MKKMRRLIPKDSQTVEMKYVTLHLSLKMSFVLGVEKEETLSGAWFPKSFFFITVKTQVYFGVSCAFPFSGEFVRNKWWSSSKCVTSSSQFHGKLRADTSLLAVTNVLVVCYSCKVVLCNPKMV